MPANQLDPFSGLKLRSPSMRRLSLLESLEQSQQQRQQRDLSATPMTIGSGVRSTISGLAAAGNVLDLAGSTARDLLAGENPLDQYLTPTSSENRISGRDLLKKWNLVGRNKPGLDVGDVLGFGAEVAADPLTYMTFGASALSKAGKTAKAAGLASDLPRVATELLGRRVGPREAKFVLNVQNLIEAENRYSAAAGRPLNALQKFLTAGGSTADLNRNLGGNFSLSIPFTDAMSAMSLPGGQALARGMDTVGNAIRYGQYSPIRPLAALLDKRNMGALAAESQQRFARLSGDLTKREAEAKQSVARIATQIEQSGMFDVDRIARETNVPLHTAAQNVLSRQQAILDYVERGVPLPADLAFTQQHLDQMRTTLDNLPAFETSMGLDSKVLNDAFTKYFPRQPIMLGDGGARANARAFRTTSPHQQTRQLTGHPGGTNALQQMSLDHFFQPYRENAAQRALGTKGRLLPNELADLQNHIQLNYVDTGLLQLPADPAEARQALRHLATTFGTLSPDHVTRGIPMFEPNLLKPYLSRIEHSARATGVVGMTQQLMADVADPLGALDPAPSIADVISRMPGIDAEKYAERVIAMLDQRDFGGGPGAASKILAALRAANPDAPAVHALRSFLIPQQVGRDIERVVRGFTAPEEASRFAEYIDRFTSLWKMGQTSLWPAFHFRNFVSGMYQNFIGEALSFDSLLDAHHIQRRGSVIQGLAAKVPMFRGMTDEQATQRLRELMFAHDISGYRQGLTSETLGDAVGSPFGGIPGADPIFRAPHAGTTLRQRLNPLRSSAITGGEDVFAGERIGRDLAKYVEGLNRGTAFIELLKRGVDPGEAAGRTLALQVDYRNLSKFEKTYMRRAVPFYAFSRGVLPFTVEELISKPGGRLGRTIMTASKLHNQDEYTPDYVADTASVKLATLPDGSKRFLTGFGLMFEDPAQLNPLSSSGVRGTLLEALSRTNPLIKGPLEWATGQTFFQRSGPGGRPLEDLDPTLGRTVANVRQLMTGQETQRARPLGGPALEWLVSQSPLSRGATTLRQLTDPRKLNAPGGLALNLLTGARVADISPAAQEAMLREQAYEQMKQMGGRTFFQTYIPQEEKARMSPVELQQAKALEALLAQLALRAKERKGK